MVSITDIVIRPVSWDHPDGVNLRAILRNEMAALGGGDPGTAPLATDIPFFIVVYCADMPVGCGGLRPLSSSDAALSKAAEVKRMFVDPVYRGLLDGSIGAATSIAESILFRLEDEALRNGWSLVLLETGASFARSRCFYERRGFVQRDMFRNYGEGDNSVCYEKRLDSN